MATGAVKGKTFRERRGGREKTNFGGDEEKTVLGKSIGRRSLGGKLHHLRGGTAPGSRPISHVREGKDRRSGGRNPVKLEEVPCAVVLKKRRHLC